jgi:hypothetical protein
VEVEGGVIYGEGERDLAGDSGGGKDGCLVDLRIVSGICM